MQTDILATGHADCAIIPGTVNIPWDTLNIGKSDPAAVQEMLESQLGAKRRDDSGISTTPGRW